jgi:hypothetical protein
MADEKPPPLRLPGAPKPNEVLLRAAKKAAYENTRVDRVIAHLERVWGSERPCPYCGSIVWAVDPDPVSIQRHERPGVIPAYMVTCKTCGQTTFLLAEAIGVPVEEP